ncbi:MAG: phosphatidylglycerophosphatase A [Pseudomonadales bacterium]|nr:phosphatidylglycerophosphatase A [Pseudomonadales bacterium]
MKSLPHFKWSNPIHLLALGFGSGAVPKAPGTFGTLIGVLFYFPMTYLSHAHYLVLVGFLFVAGIYICGRTAKDFGVHDHGSIVWDEIVGYLITMIFAPTGWPWIVLGFVLFRIFDIWKPWPISLLDKKVHGGFGIMIDDVLAGVYAMGVMAIVNVCFQL